MSSGNKTKYVSWIEARNATLHCLTGCAIGEVTGMIIGTALGLDNIHTVIISVTLAFLFGYALTMKSVLKSGVSFRTALAVAFAADTVSIAVMEVVDNGIMLSIPGAMNAGLINWVFWAAMVVSLAIAFLVAWPVNRLLISKGLGHAKAHAYHQHHNHEEHHDHTANHEHMNHASHH
jgi:ABC-type nickel/cobalt efflux system permease component RcnA